MLGPWWSLLAGAEGWGLTYRGGTLEYLLRLSVKGGASDAGALVVSGVGPGGTSLLVPGEGPWWYLPAGARGGALVVPPCWCQGMGLGGTYLLLCRMLEPWWFILAVAGGGRGPIC